MIRILHAADLHLDSPFDALSEEKAALRRREQRELPTWSSSPATCLTATRPGPRRRSCCA